jgi:hypothetical protein
MSITLILAIFVFNIASYYSANTDLNVQSRYFFSILPILIAMSIVATNELLGKRPLLKVVLLFFFVVITLQGGGLTKHIIGSNDKWYWQRPKIININTKTRQIIEPLIFESSKY